MIRLAFDACCWLVVVLIPLLGAWLASSLLAYANGPAWLAATAGLLGFPILPVAWEVWAGRRRARTGRPAQRRGLSWGERVIARTLVLNLLLFAAVLASSPQIAFTALSARGDWFLDGRHDASAERARRALFWTADKLEWLHSLTRDNPYAELADTDGQQPPDPSQLPEDPSPALASDDEASGEALEPPDPAPNPRPKADPTASDDPSGTARPNDLAQEGETGPAEIATATAVDHAVLGWPPTPTPHPLAAEIPADDVETAAAFVRRRLPDPVERFRALHDFVALRTAYDRQALTAGRYPPQDAATVLRTRLAVCAGYANLLKALGTEAGLEVVVVTGDSRDMGGEIAGGGHAWNAVQLDGRWHLVDATWNAGAMEGGRFVPRYGVEYLFTPPAVFAVDHLPDDPRWQLLRRPVSRGEFTRQPLLRPGLAAAGIELISPTRSQVNVPRRSELLLRNRGDKFLLAQLRTPGAGDGENLPLQRDGDRVRVDVELPGPGTFQVYLFVGEQEYGSFRFAGQIELHGR